MQINRLFEIIYILLNKEKVSASELSTRFEVSTRTIYRDIDILSSAGIPVFATKGKGGGIGLMPQFVLNKTVLTEKEKAEILTSLHAVSAVNLGENGEVLQKLSSLFGGHNQEWLEVDFSNWYNGERDGEIFHLLKNAIMAKIMVRFHYTNGKGEQVLRTVEPLRLCFKGMARYLYGFCRVREDFRFFKLSRIHNITLLEDKFTRSLDCSVLKGLAIKEEQYITLKLILTNKVAFRVYDEFANFETLEDGSFLAEILFPEEENALFSYIASFGEECEILEPIPIREAYQNKCKRIYEKYL